MEKFELQRFELWRDNFFSLFLKEIEINCVKIWHYIPIHTTVSKNCGWRMHASTYLLFKLIWRLGTYFFYQFWILGQCAISYFLNTITKNITQYWWLLYFNARLKTGLATRWWKLQCQVYILRAAVALVADWWSVQC